MIALSCPSCGAQVSFVSKITVFAVCPYCNCTILRNDVELKNLGEMAVLQDDYSVLQKGTCGVYDGKQFNLVGRVKYEWERGNWMEWFAYFPDSSYPDGGWLAEAQGFYALSFFERAAVDLPKLETLTAGTEVELQGARFTVTDIKHSKVAYSEGELPFAAQKGAGRTSADLSGEGDWFACLEYYDSGSSLFLGRYATFEELQFQSVKVLDGW